MSGAGERQALSIPPLDAGDDLDDFAPRQVTSKSIPETRRAIDEASAFPSREASPDAQLNLKGPRHILERFKAMCKEDRRPYYDMLEVLMNSFEGKR